MPISKPEWEPINQLERQHLVDAKALTGDDLPHARGDPEPFCEPFA